MNTAAEREAAKRRRSAWVTIGVAGALVVGCPILLYQCNQEDEDEADPVVAGKAYENNSYIPGAGYYHSGYGGFFPFRYNQFDAGRGGYYHGGGWHSTPGVSNVAASVPDRGAVAQANSNYRASRPSTRGGFGKTGSFFSSRS